MKKPNMKTKKRYTLTISEKVYIEFQKYCYENLQSVSGTVNKLIEAYLINEYLNNQINNNK